MARDFFAGYNFKNPKPPKEEKPGKDQKDPTDFFGGFEFQNRPKVAELEPEPPPELDMEFPDPRRKFKIRTFHGIDQSMDENDLPLEPDCFTYKGVNFWIENGNLKVRNNYGAVTAEPIRTSATDTNLYYPSTMTILPASSITGYPVISCAVYTSSGVVSHRAILCFLDRTEHLGDTGYYWTELAYASTDGTSFTGTYRPRYAVMKLINYILASGDRTLIGTQFSSNPYNEPPICIYYNSGLGAYSIRFLKADGYMNATVDTGTDVFTCLNAFVDTNAIEFYSLGNDLPAPLVQGTTYYVVNAAGNTFKVSATSGGAAINITTTGTGVGARLISNRTTDAPVADDIMLHNDRVWLSMGGATNKLYHSAALDPTDWSTALSAGDIDVSTWDGDSIRHIINFDGDPLALMENRIWRITGETPPYGVQQVFGAKGTNAPRSVCYYKNNLFYAAPEGIMVFNGMSAEPFLSQEIRDLWYPDYNTKAQVIKDTLMFYSQQYNAVTGVLGYHILAVDLNTKNVCQWDMMSPVVNVLNFVTNGNFVNTTGWTGSACSIAAAGNILSATGDGSSALTMVYQTTALTWVAGHVVCFRAIVRAKSADVLKLALKLEGTGGGMIDNLSIQATPVNNTTYSLSGIGTLPAGSGTIIAMIYATYPDAATANGKVIECEAALGIDFTNSFGAGYGPTAAQLETILETYSPSSKWFNNSVALDISVSPCPLQIDSIMDPWLTTIKSDVYAPEFWFARKSMIYKYDTTAPAATKAQAMSYYLPTSDLGDSASMKNITNLAVTGKGGTALVTPTADGTDGTAQTVELPATVGVITPVQMGVSAYLLGMRVENVGGDPIEVRDIQGEFISMGG
jgi:hypothetical protein